MNEAEIDKAAPEVAIPNERLVSMQEIKDYFFAQVEEECEEYTVAFVDCVKESNFEEDVPRGVVKWTLAYAHSNPGLESADAYDNARAAIEAC